MATQTMRGLLDGPFYFMRHGESTTNAKDLVAGLTDAHLSEVGLRQAADAAEQLREIHLASVIVTGLYRTHQSAVPILEQKGLPPFVEPGLNERDWGELEGRPLSERPSTFHNPPGGETWEDFADRIWRAAQYVRVPAPTLLLAHSGTFRAMLYKMGFGKVRPQLGNAVVVEFRPLTPAPAQGPAWEVVDLAGVPMEIKPLEEDMT